MYRSTLSLTSWEWLVNARPRPLYPWERGPVPIIQEAGWVPGPVWMGVERLVFTGIRSQDRPVRSESLRLHYAGSDTFIVCRVTELCSVTDVLGNLTALRVLDLSHNDLTELSGALFGPPPNLTALYLQHNLLTMLPLAELVSLKPQLRIVDVRANRLQHFHHEWMPLVDNGTLVLYEGTYEDRYHRSSRYSPSPSCIVYKTVPAQAVKACGRVGE